MVLIRSEWTMPVISNYSEWVIPEIEWGSNETVFLPAPEKGGQLDELQSPYRLIRVIEGRQDVVADDIAAGCSSLFTIGAEMFNGLLRGKPDRCRNSEKRLTVAHFP